MRQLKALVKPCSIKYFFQLGSILGFRGCFIVRARMIFTDWFCGAQEALLRDVEARDARALKASLKAVVLAAPGAPPNSRTRSSAATAARQARTATPSASADSGAMVS